MSGVVWKGSEGVQKYQYWILLIRIGERVADKSILKQLTVDSYRKRIKFVHQTVIQRFDIGPKRLFEQLLNSSGTVPILFMNRIGCECSYSIHE